MNRRATRRTAALVATLLWGLGLHVQPLLHNIDHRPDHSHGSFELAHRLADTDAESHSHAAPHTHVYPEPGLSSGLRPHLRDFAPPDPASSEEADSSPASDIPRERERGTDPEHGRTSVLHFAAAVLESQPFDLPGLGPAIHAAVAAVPRVMPRYATRLLPPRGPPSSRT